MNEYRDYFGIDGYERGPDLYQGRPRRTKRSHPYSYDPFVIWGAENQKDHAYYTDRMQQWDYTKYERLCQQHFEWPSFNPHARPHIIETFLSDYLGRKVTLTCVMEWCNQASGFPLWTMHWQEIPANGA